MPETVLSYFSRLKPDSWREASEFSPDIDAANREMFVEEHSASRRLSFLRDWLENEQPCLFGRAAAKLDSLRYCILTERDLQQSDEWIRDKIQESRLRWTRDAFEGTKSGFIIWVVSPRIALAEPDSAMLALSRRICELYLGREIEPDRIYLDEIFLEKPGSARTTWKWFTGVNYFCSQGDKRWWHDHRIPGGMAFSVNSVGHFVKSSILRKGMNQLNNSLGLKDDDYRNLPIDSLHRALQVAMHTISLASETVSGKATELLPLPNDRSQMTVAECPFPLPARWADKNFCEYKGYYHTDFTLPSEYFVPSVERPAGTSSYLLDFTYLFNSALENPDFVTMGEGRQVRAVQVEHEEASFGETPKLPWSNPRELLANEIEVPIDTELRLLRSLKESKYKAP